MSPCGVFNVNAGAAVPGLSRVLLVGAGASDALLSSIFPTPGISCGWNPTFAAATRSDLGAFRSAAVGLAGPGAEGAWLSRFSTAAIATMASTTAPVASHMLRCSCRFSCWSRWSRTR